MILPLPSYGGGGAVIRDGGGKPQSNCQQLQIMI